MGHNPLRTVEIKINPLLERFGGLPRRGSVGAAGYDLVACIEEPVTIEPGSTAVIGSGVSVHVRDPNYAAFVLPRSGAGIKKGIVLANLVGLIDSDYQGEIKLGLWNRNRDEAVVVEPGERVAQMVFMPVALVDLVQVADFTDDSERGQKGLGSTGRFAGAGAV